MSNKLYKLENIMNKIFEQVKKDPSSADELHKLMNYYLPTTKKLLSAYVELDKQDSAGENVMQTKREIDMAMDTINLAFEKLLDSLFQDMAWDISSDISVMKTMMAQDGLTNEGGMAMATATASASAAQAMQQEE
jgi:5-bromo-4-chloroindolyl phosphate hydrolysis protein